MVTPPTSSMVGLSFALDLPPPGLFFSLSPATLVLVPGNQLGFIVPQLASLPGVMVYAQGLTKFQPQGALQFTNTATLRVDF